MIFCMIIGWFLIPALCCYDSICLCVLQDNTPDAADVVLSFDELHLTESPTIETVPQRHKSAGSSADDEHSLRLDGHRSDYNNINMIISVRAKTQLLLALLITTG
jgi:hypothetical protein